MHAVYNVHTPILPGAYLFTYVIIAKDEPNYTYLIFSYFMTNISNIIVTVV